VTGYGVYNGSASVGTTAATSTSYTVSGLACGTGYTVAVDAYDAAGNRSGKSTVSVSTAACSGSANAYVSTSGNDSTCVRGDTTKPCASFAGAYNIAQCGDRVSIAGGTYPAQTLNHRAALDGCTSPVTFSNSGKVTINGGGSNALRFNGVKHVAVVSDSLANFKVVAPQNQGGGGLVIGPSGSVRSADITIRYVDVDGDLHLDSLDGGTIDHSDIGPTNTTTSFNHESQIIDNSLLGPSRNLMISYNVFHDATSDGVAHTSCLTGWYIDTTIRGNTFARCDNEGILIKAGWMGSSPWLRNITIEGNFFAAACSTCGVGPDGGMTINTNGSQGTASNPYSGFVIRGNSYHDPPSFNASNGVTFTNSFFTGNILPRTSSSNTGATTCAPGLTAANNVFVGGPACGTNALSVSTYPYVNGMNTMGLDYHLAGVSVADNAVPASVPGGCAARDIDGQLRPMGAACDAGADER
jgi:hypothetical protein